MSSKDVKVSDKRIGVVITYDSLCTNVPISIEYDEPRKSFSNIPELEEYIKTLEKLKDALFDIM